MERIHVSVRARPLSVEDARSSPWRISGNSIFTANQSAKFEFGVLLPPTGLCGIIIVFFTDGNPQSIMHTPLPTSQQPYKTASHRVLNLHAPPPTQPIDLIATALRAKI